MSNINLRNWTINRRHFLRGIGASLSLPVLNCMQVSGKDSAKSTLPRRSVFIYIPNGVNTLDWQVQKAGFDYEFSKSLLPLREHRADLTVFSGLHHPNGVGAAHRCDKLWLTSSDVGKQTSERPNSVSVDQLMASAASDATRFPSLELTVTGGSLAWSKAGVPLPAERKPGVIFERLFGLKPGGIVAARRSLGRRAGVLDLVLDEARRFRSKIGQEDQTKLDEYLSAVREVEIRTERADAWLDIPKPHVDPEVREQMTRSIPDADAGDYYDTVFDLILLALRTDMTRVVTCMTGNERLGLAIPEIGIQQTRHELSHHNGNPEQMRRLSQTDSFMTTRLARFLDKLKALEENGESLLDRTMVLFGSGMSYGHSHGNANLPTLLAGGKGLGLKHGQHIDYNVPQIGPYSMGDVRSYYPICVQPVDKEARLSNLLLTMLQRMEVPAQSFGDSLRNLPEVLA
ncbi:MAG: hypothetical protein ACI9F9_002751 [Candidatus Paceibacteria bacterium]|jgi:hypothetical protein